MKVLGAILIGLGFLFIFVATSKAGNAPNVSHLIGSFLPGLLFLILGLALRREKRPASPESCAEGSLASAGPATRIQADRFKERANLGVGGGIVTMFLGSAIGQQGPELLLAGVAVSLGGWALVIWGCVNYVRWKGHSGWFGLFGYLLLPGLIILACFPNRRKRLLQGPDLKHASALEALTKVDGRSGYRFLLMLLPLGLLFGCVGGFLFSSRSSIDATEWKEVASASVGFEALMPGTARLEEKTLDAPAGKVQLNKFTVEPKARKEIFMIVSVKFPEGVTDQLGGTEKLLDIGRQDVIASCQGTLQSERDVVLNGYPGRELEVLPPKGAIIKARIYARKNQIYEVWVHVPKIRLASEDVRKFFDSFKLIAEPGAAPEGGNAK